MNRTLPITALTALALSGCPNPVGDAPRATVEASPAPAAAPAPAPATAPAAGVPIALTPAPMAEKALRYTFSQEGSKVEFVGAKVTKKEPGAFARFSGTVGADSENIDTAAVDVVIDIASVTTASARLTAHLLKPDFFDAANHPTARFTSTSIKKGADGNATVTGDLTLRGVTKRITFPATITTNGDTATAKAEFGINRKDFGVMYPGAPDDLVHDEVLMKLEIAAKRAP